jgi:uncharacterized protein YciI
VGLNFDSLLRQIFEMKPRSLCLILILCSSPVFAQKGKTNPLYDSTLAKKLGADNYGMKNYFFVLLKTGRNKEGSKSAKDSAFAGHMANMDSLVNECIFIVAGPFGKNDKSYRGLFILNLKTKEEVEKVLATDPAIKGQWLEAEVVPWYGSAALPEYLPYSEKIWK